MKRWMLFFTCVISFSSLAFGQVLHLVRPSETDSLISTNDNNHFIYLNSDVQSRNQLFLFLPGTGGLLVHYTLILKEAANLGYHSIGLTYPNDRTINSLSICGLTLDTTCHSRARHEIFDGIDRHPQVEVNHSNSIQNRLIKLLDFLSSEFPGENWDQYIEADEILWNKIKIAGHSQGGGHSGFIATLKPVERAIMIGSNDRIGLLARSADWMSKEGVSENNRYFGFLHEMDELVDFENALESWEDRGMFVSSSLINVDTVSDLNYEQSKTLYTQILPRNNEEKKHNSLAVDVHTPVDDDDRPLLAPVWAHLIQSPIEVVSAVTNFDYRYDELKVFPNPSRGLLRVDMNGRSNYKTELQVMDSMGAVVYENDSFVFGKYLDLNHLSTGVYILKAYTKSQNISIQKILIVK
jgi:hypothetical protein